MLRLWVHLLPELVGKLGNHAEQGRPEYRLKALCRLLFRQNRRRGCIRSRHILRAFAGADPRGIEAFLIEKRQDPRIGDVVAPFRFRNAALLHTEQGGDIRLRAQTRGLKYPLIGVLERHGKFSCEAPGLIKAKPGVDATR